MIGSIHVFVVATVAVTAAVAVVAGCERAPRVPASAAGEPACGGDAATLDACAEGLLVVGRLEDAERAWRAALAQRADFAPAYDGLAMIQFHRGDDAGGVAALENGLAVAGGGDDPGPRIRLLENLAWAHMLAGREADAFAAIAASVEAQALETDAATAGVNRLGRARLLLLVEAWDRAGDEARAARTGDAPAYVGWVSRALEVRALAGAGSVAAAANVLAALVTEIGSEHPLTIDPAFDLALARGDLAAAAGLATALGDRDPYAGERAQLALAVALTRAGRAADAAPLLDEIAARHLRSVGSSQIRRVAADLRARPAR